MKTFKEYLTEQTGTFEIPTLKAKSYKAELEKKGFIVKVADDDGLVVVGDKAKLQAWLKSKDWDPEEIKSILS